MVNEFSFHKRDDYPPLPPFPSLSRFIFRSFSLSAYGESLQKYTCCRHLRRRVSAVVPLIKPKEFESGNSPPLFLNHTQICLPLPHYLFQPLLKGWVTTVIDKLVKQNLNPMSCPSICLLCLLSICCLCLLWLGANAMWFIRGLYRCLCSLRSTTGNTLTGSCGAFDTSTNKYIQISS